jgi:hypothetical protein
MAPASRCHVVSPLSRLLGLSASLSSLSGHTPLSLSLRRTIGLCPGTTLIPLIVKNKNKNKNCNSLNINGTHFDSARAAPWKIFPIRQLCTATRNESFREMFTSASYLTSYLPLFQTSSCPDSLGTLYSLILYFLITILWFESQSYVLFHIH